MACVTVDEVGTPAVVVAETSVPTLTPLTIDRPLLYVMRDETTDSVLFIGRVMTCAIAADIVGGCGCGQALADGRGSTPG
jgi:serine protease inhibitor